VTRTSVCAADQSCIDNKCVARRVSTAPYGTHADATARHRDAGVRWFHK
jgi:hypothetical protein